MRTSEGLNGSDRLVFTWNDQAILNQWLQVTARTSLGLATPDVFYFGNLVGDVNGDAFTSPLDVTILVNAINSQGGPYVVGIDDPLDVNRDGLVSAADASLVV
ncbi:dockerin type I domain-containing protein, partial [Arthrospira platensis SPKY2]